MLTRCFAQAGTCCIVFVSNLDLHLGIFSLLVESFSYGGVERNSDVAQLLAGKHDYYVNFTYSKYLYADILMQVQHL